MTKQALLWQIPVLLFLLFLPFATFFDLHVSSCFVDSDFRFRAPTWCVHVYRYGPVFGQLLFVVSCLLTAYGMYAKQFQLWFYSWYIALTLLISAGLIGHLACKQFWARPRPSDTTQFGGKYPYCHPLHRYQGYTDKQLKSLPSGHATWGFYFITLFFLGRRLNCRALSTIGLCSSLLCGGILSLGRLIQGGHFLSDVLASAVIMWLVAYFLDQWFDARARTTQAPT